MSGQLVLEGSVPGRWVIPRPEGPVPANTSAHQLSRSHHSNLSNERYYGFSISLGCALTDRFGKGGVGPLSPFAQNSTALRRPREP